MEKDPLLPRYDWRIGSEVTAPSSTSLNADESHADTEQQQAEQNKTRININERLVSLDAVRGCVRVSL